MKYAFTLLLLGVFSVCFAQTACVPVKILIVDEESHEILTPANYTLQIKGLALDGKTVVSDTTIKMIYGQPFCLKPGPYKVWAGVALALVGEEHKPDYIITGNEDTVNVDLYVKRIHPYPLKFPVANFPPKKYELDAIAQKNIDTIITILKENPQLVFEIDGHTDSRGHTSANMRLSEQRAKTVFDYIVGKGIAAARLEIKWYGETELLNFCVDGKICSEEEHAINNRVEFKIVRFDYKEPK